MVSILEHISFYEENQKIPEELYKIIHKQMESIISELINYFKDGIKAKLDSIVNKESKLVYVLVPKKWLSYKDSILDYILKNIDENYKDKIKDNFYFFISNVAEAIWNSLLIDIMVKNGFRKVNYMIDVLQLEEKYEKNFGTYLDFSISENDILLYSL